MVLWPEESSYMTTWLICGSSDTVHAYYPICNECYSLILLITPNAGARARHPRVVFSTRKRFTRYNRWNRRGLPASQSASKDTIEERKNPEYLCAPRGFLKKMSAMFDNCTILTNESMRKVCLFYAWSCSSDLAVLRAKDHGLFILISHKPTRSENPITWRLLWENLASLGPVSGYILRASSANFPIRTRENWSR